MPSWAEAYLSASHPTFYPAIFVLLLLAGLGFPISADLVLIACSYIVYTGNAEPWPVILAAGAGILISDTCMFHIGKNLGSRLTTAWPLKKVLTPPRIERAKSSFQIQGYRIVFLARFMPGIRTVFMFTSGLLSLRYWKFIAYDFAGALIVVPAMIFSMSWVAGNKDALMAYLHQFQWVILGAAVIYFAIWFTKYSKRKSVKASSKTESDLSAPHS